jgi:hypothetical protein
MLFTSRKAWLLAVALALSVGAGAQVKTNPVTGINWPQATGSGAPASGLCTSITRGQPYTDITGNNSYICGSSGWFQTNSGGGGGGSIVSVFGRTGTVVATSGDYSVSQIVGAAGTVSPAFTGTPTAPTQACASNTDVATGAYVAACAAPIGSGVTRIIAGSGVTIAPTGGTGNVTINATSTSSTAFSALTGSTNTTAAMVIGTGASLGVTGSGTIAATSAPYSGLTGSVPIWNQNTTGTAANVTAATNATLTTLSALTLPYGQLTGTVPTWNQNTTGTATNVSGTPTLPNGTKATTQTTGDSTANLATDMFVNNSIAAGGFLTSALGASTYAPLVSAHLTGTPTAPTQGTCAANTDIATGAYVAACATATGGVTQLIAGTNVTLSPPTGVGAVTITASSSTAALAFSAITGSTNTGAAMLVGSGASLGVTGTGTIAATSAAAVPGTGVTGSTLAASITTAAGLTTVAGGAFGTAAFQPASAFEATGSSLPIGGGTLTGALVIEPTATGSIDPLAILQTALATGNSTSILLGTAETTNNAGDLEFINAGTGSAANSLAIGLIGDPQISISTLGALTVPNVLVVNNPSTGSGNTASFISSATVSTNSFVDLTPSLGTGSFNGMYLGTAPSTNNGVELLFNNVGGGGSAGNTFTMALLGEPGVTLTSTGGLTAAGALTAGTNVIAPSLNATTTGTTNTAPVLITAASLGVGNTTGIAGGLGLATNNDFDILFENVGGSGASSNLMEFGIVNSPQITVGTSGQMNVPGLLTASGGLVAPSYGGTLTSAPTTCTGNELIVNPAPTGPANVLGVCFEGALSFVPTSTSSAGVTTLNGLAGGLSLTSPSGTVTVTPSGSTIALNIPSPLTLSDGGTTNTIPLTLVSPSLGANTPTSVVLGTAVTTGNALQLTFNNVGTGSSSNNAVFGVLGDPLISVSTAGALNVPSTVTSTGLNTRSIIMTGVSGTAAALEINNVPNGSHEWTMVPTVNNLAFTDVTEGNTTALILTGVSSGITSATFEGAVNAPTFSASGGFAGSGSVTVAPQAAAGSGATASCTTGHVCDMFSGNVSLTTTTTTATGNILVISFPVTRSHNPNCTFNILNATTSPPSAIVSPTENVSTSQLVFVANGAIPASSQFQFIYVCGGQ